MVESIRFPHVRVGREGLQAVIVNVDMATMFEDHFDLKATAPLVFDDTTLEHTAAAVDGGDVGAAARQTNRNIDEAVTSRVDNLQDGFYRRGTIARAGLLYKQLVRFVMKTRIVTARCGWLRGTATWFHVLIGSGRLTGETHENGSGQQ